jgi:hypothetical protein
VNSITAHLQVAQVAATALAQLSPLIADFPQLEPVIDHCTYLMNESLDFVTDELSLYFPDIPAAAPINGKTNGCTVPGFSGIPVVGASIVALANEDGLDPEEDEEEAWEPASEREVSRCKALLLEVLRRAAHDWVLYRQHKKLEKRELAHDAYIWLFEEDDHHPYRRERINAMFPGRSGRPPTRGTRLLTSFQSVCENLDLDPETVRACIKKMDARSIISSGRPPQQRTLAKDAEELPECEIQVEVPYDEDPESENYISQYESIGAVPTSSVVYFGLKEPRGRAPSPEGEIY